MAQNIPAGGTSILVVIFPWKRSCAMTVKWAVLLLIAPTLLLVSCSDVEDGYGTKGAITQPITAAKPPGATYNAPLTVTLVTDRLATIY